MCCLCVCVFVLCVLFWVCICEGVLLSILMGGGLFDLLFVQFCLFACLLFVVLAFDFCCVVIDLEFRCYGIDCWFGFVVLLFVFLVVLFSCFANGLFVLSYCLCLG